MCTHIYLYKYVHTVAWTLNMVTHTLTLISHHTYAVTNLHIHALTYTGTRTYILFRMLAHSSLQRMLRAWCFCFVHLPLKLYCCVLHWAAHFFVDLHENTWGFLMRSVTWIECFLLGKKWKKENCDITMLPLATWWDIRHQQKPLCCLHTITHT